MTTPFLKTALKTSFAALILGTSVAVASGVVLEGEEYPVAVPAAPLLSFPFVDLADEYGNAYRASCNVHVLILDVQGLWHALGAQGQQLFLQHSRLNVLEEVMQTLSLALETGFADIPTNVGRQTAAILSPALVEFGVRHGAP